MKVSLMFNRGEKHVHLCPKALTKVRSYLFEEREPKEADLNYGNNT